MAYEPRRTLVVGLSALAVVLVAALFPAAGIGSHPGASGVGSPGATDAAPTPTPTPTPAPATPTEPRDEPTESTPADTPSQSSTEAPPGDGGDIWPELSLAALLGAAGKLFAVTLGGGLLVALALVVRGAEPGTPHVELPFGYTVTLPFTVPMWVGHLGTRISRLTMGFVVSVSASVTQLLDASAAALRAVTGALGILAGEGVRGTLALLAGLPGAFVGALAGLTALPSSLRSVPGTLSTVGGALRSRDARPDDDVREVGPDPVEADEPTEEGPPTVQEAWVAMTDLLPVERRPSTTPAEFARAAVDRGVPAGPVRRLTRAFEDVVYGGYPAGDRAAAARDALARLRDRLGGDA